MSIAKTIQLTFPVSKSGAKEWIAIEKEKWQRIRQQVEEFDHVLRTVIAGERERRMGKTRVVQSLRELL
ncbi:MAG: hypothetical protein HYV42_03725 [Candidatus Magasanikbacteria bacterium]|nr:hypothetical protein [Candidatus Magasanikbacteria bacterium]